MSDLVTCIDRLLDDPTFPSLEIRIKSLNYVGDLLLEQLQRFHDKRPILERYFRGEIEYHHHGSGAGYCTVTTVVDGNNNSCKSNMFVGIGKSAKSAGPCATVTRLQSLERCLVGGCHSMKPHLATIAAGRRGSREMLIPGVFRIFNEELRATLMLTGVQINKLMNEVVEGAPEIVERLPNENGEDWGCIDILYAATDEGWTHYGPHNRSIRRCSGNDLTFNVNDVVICPVYSRTRIIEGWLTAIGAGEAA